MLTLTQAAAMICALLLRVWGWHQKSWIGWVLSGGLFGALALTYSRTGAVVAFVEIELGYLARRAVLGCGRRRGSARELAEAWLEVMRHPGPSWLWGEDDTFRLKEAEQIEKESRNPLYTKRLSELWLKQ